MSGKKSISNILLTIDNKSNFKDKNYCRFTMFVRIKAGYISPFKDMKRTWCFRGDKYTNEEDKMLRNLLNLLKNNFEKYDRIIIYDHQKTIDEKEIVKIIDHHVAINKLHKYQEALCNYALPKFLK